MTRTTQLKKVTGGGTSMQRCLLSFLLVLTVSACAEREGPQAWSVLPPGQGTNLLEMPRDRLPDVYTSQLGMFTSLPDSVEGMDDADIPRFYKPLDFAAVPTTEIASEIAPKDGLRIVRDALHNVPRIYADTRGGAMFGVGYAQAQDRLWQMVINRHTSRGSLASILGRGVNDENLESDLRTLRVLDYTDAEYDQMYAQLCRDYGRSGRQACEDFKNYVDGINAFIEATMNDRSLLPVEFKRRNITPQKWSIADTLAYTAFAHVRSGGRGFALRELGNSNLLQELVLHLGQERAEQVYGELRDNDDPETPAVISLADSGSQDSLPPFSHSKAIALVDLGSFQYRQVLWTGDSAVRVAEDSSGIGYPYPSKSNALLVAGSISSTGHPLSIQGPQDGYQLPHIDDWEVMVEAPDYMVRGCIEWHGPYPYNGARGHDFVFSGTAQFIDQIDMFAERLCEPDGSDASINSTHYAYRGQCIPLEALDVPYTVRDEVAGSVRRLLRSVHGPVIGYASVDSHPVALAQARSTFMQEERGLPALADVFSPSMVQSAQDFLRIMSQMPRQLAYYYADRDDIAFVNPGLVPVRHEASAGDLPIWGTGEWDWQDFDPDSRRFASVPAADLPQIINPSTSIIAGWNNHPLRGWSVADYIWDSGPLHRVRLLEDPVKELAGRRKVTASDLIRIHTLAGITDGRAKLFYPIVRRLLTPEVVEDPALAEVLQRADAWVAEGALRRDKDADGYLDHGQAIAVLHAWWPILIRAVFEPGLGAQVLNGSGGKANNLPPIESDIPSGAEYVPADPAEVGPRFAAPGWFNLLARDIRQVLGEPVRRPFLNAYCGSGELTRCRRLALESLRIALREALVRVPHSDDGWQIPVTCNGCLQNNYFPTGDAPNIEPSLWQSRPTFEIVSAFR